jgi:multidrug efflux pump subunit AcrA (membrane-fusion protein)
MLVLLAAFLIYLILHLLWPAQVRSASVGLDALVAQTAEQVGSSPALSTNAELSANLAEIRRIATALGANTQSGLTAADNAELDSLLTQIEAAVAQDARAAARLAVLRLQYLLRFLGTPAYYWTGEPGRYIEVLFWALAGVVVSQLVDTSTYLRRGTYLRDGLWFLSCYYPLATLEITLDSGGKIRLDLGDPRILAAVAFIFGLSFWRSWDSLQGFSQRFLGGESPST